MPTSSPKKYGIIAEKYIHNVPEIEKYVIMPDHIHMIIRIYNGTMWEDYLAVRGRCHEVTEGDGFVKSSPTKRIENIIRSFKILTTKEIGMSIFQRSFYDHIIRNQKDYNETWEYIENNPLKWKILHSKSQDE